MKDISKTRASDTTQNVNKIDQQDISSVMNIKITVLGLETTVLLECAENMSLLEAMVRHEIYISTFCGGRGTCGKCKIQLIQGELGISTADRTAFSKEELQEGYRLSCKAYAISDCSIKLITPEEPNFEVLADSLGMPQSIIMPASKEDDYAVAIDIGTTTIAISLLERKSNNLLYTYTSTNRQRVYGADVISRIKASNEGKQEKLKESIQRDLLLGIRTVIEKAGVSKESIKNLVIASNTTMRHLLLGYSCKTLGSYPFTPVNIAETTLSFQEVFGAEDLNAKVTFLPGISTFVGGDITAGLLACNFDKVELPCLLIDLGTNGELAIGTKNKILVSSTAAGPVFEGGSISCGVGSIVGAICNVKMEDDKLRYETISGKPPVGICGTGVIELLAELSEAGLVDHTGLLKEEYFLEGFTVAVDQVGKAIILTQKDIREIQLAKAAIRAGIEILVNRFGTTYEKIETVYLAGGFGYQLNTQKALRIGLLPKEFSGKIKTVGNSALGGAMKYSLEQTTQNSMEHMVKVSKEIYLSDDQDFNELYIKYMNLQTDLDRV